LQSLSAIEKGLTLPSLETIDLLVINFNVDLFYIFYGNTNYKNNIAINQVISSQTQRIVIFLTTKK